MLPPNLTTFEPRLHAAFVAYVDGVRAHAALPAGLIDACGARIAQLLTGAALGTVHDDEVFAAAIAFAEQFVLDAQALDAVTVERVRAAVGESGLAVLALGVGLMEGLVRARLAWGLPPLPEWEAPEPSA
jgi:hypothetical protein